MLCAQCVCRNDQVTCYKPLRWSGLRGVVCSNLSATVEFFFVNIERCSLAFCFNTSRKFLNGGKSVLLFNFDIWFSELGTVVDSSAWWFAGYSKKTCLPRFLLLRLEERYSLTHIKNDRIWLRHWVSGYAAQVCVCFLGNWVGGSQDHPQVWFTKRTRRTQLIVPLIATVYSSKRIESRVRKGEKERRGWGLEEVKCKFPRVLSRWSHTGWV